MYSKSALHLWVVLLLSGCASDQLNYNTLDLASTTDKLLTQQVLYNVEKFIDSDAAVPAQITITSGTASTTNSVSPSFSSPLGHVFAATTGALGAVTSKVTTSNPVSASVNASDTWAQNWGFSPITDVYQMRRLRALYRYSVDGDADAFVRSYPLLYKSVSVTRPECLRDASGDIEINIPSATDANGGKAKGADRPSKLCATQYTANGDLSVGGATESDAKLVPDEHYLRGPACIVCLRRSKARKGHLTKNENLQAGWLRWVNLPGAGNSAERPPAPGDRSLGVYGHHELFLAQGQGDKLVEFTLFVLAASTQTDATASSNSSLAQSKTGGGKPATQSIVDTNGNVSTVFPGN